MPRNLEIKARIHDIESAVLRAEKLPARPAGRLIQCDTYFNTAAGRLKLRETEGSTAELIFYLRPDATSSRISDFSIIRCDDPLRLKDVLSRSLGIRAEVRKVRLLFMFDDIRIHIDDVAGIGQFIEFEIPLRAEEQDRESAMNSLVAYFAIEARDCFKGSYIDLVQDTP